MHDVTATPGRSRPRRNWYLETDASPVGWEFAALWVDDEADARWQWVWRRVADDSGAVIAESTAFPHLDLCLEDARRNGFDEEECGPTS